MTKYKYSRKFLLRDLYEITKNVFNGKGPTMKEANNELEASPNTYVKRFGSWNDALQEAGIEPENLPEIPKRKLIEEIERVSKEEFNGDSPSCMAMEKYSNFSNKTFQDKFGSWNKALQEADFKVNQEPNYEEEDLLDELRRVSREYCDGQTPQADDIDSYGKWTTPVYYDVFGSFNSALKKADFSLNRRSPGEGSKIEYGESYNRELKHRIYSRDDYTCAVCNSKNFHGYKPDIHHITPHYYWKENEHEKMNHPRNLISLCRSCHRTLEGMFKARNYEEFRDLARKAITDEEADKGSIYDY